MYIYIVMKSWTDDSGSADQTRDYSEIQCVYDNENAAKRHCEIDSRMYEGTTMTSHYIKEMLITIIPPNPN